MHRYIQRLDSPPPFCQQHLFPSPPSLSLFPSNHIAISPFDRQPFEGNPADPVPALLNLDHVPARASRQSWRRDASGPSNLVLQAESSDGVEGYLPDCRHYGY